MSRSGAEKDQAGREFEALLAALPRRSPAQRDAAPLGDAQFENLLNDFRSLSSPTPPRRYAGPAPATPARKPESGLPRDAQPDIAAMLDALARERDRLTSRRDAVHDETAFEAIENLDRLTTNLQIALLRNRPDRVLLLCAAGQHFALALSEVTCTLGSDEVEFDEKKGVRVGDDWIPVRLLGAYRQKKNLPAQGAGSDRIVIVTAGAGALALRVEAVAGVACAAFAPLDAILRGAHGLRGMAVTEAGVHALVLDIDRLTQKA
jgi:hypothetical protein